MKAISDKDAEEMVYCGPKGKASNTAYTLTYMWYNPRTHKIEIDGITTLEEAISIIKQLTDMLNLQK